MTETQSSPLVIPILSAANFIIGMGAFMIVGLLNPLADSFGISAAAAGWMMIYYALGYAVLSPVLVSVTGTVGRRRIMTIGILLFAVSNLVAALAPNTTILFGSRILTAAGAGLLTPVAAAVAAALSPTDRQARALSAVFFGLTLSQVLGVPVGGFIAYTFGWRTAFAVVFALSLPIAALIWFRVPAGLSFQPISISDLGRTLGNPRQMIAVSFTTFFLGSVYLVYTYISPLLSDVMGYGRDGVTAVLLMFGLGAVPGNLLGGYFADRIGPYRTLFGLACAQAAIMPFFSILPLHDLALMGLAFLWALFGWSFAAPQQVRLIQLDPQNASVLLALNAAAIYIGAAVGAAIGAGVINTAGLSGLGIAGGAGALLSASVLSLGNRLNSRPL